MEYTKVSTNELYHHGILGMKWGVRRFQDKDGHYTQKGLERYNKKATEYEDARSAYKANKTKANRNKMKIAKSRLSDSYDSLKIDRRADKGEKLYEKGHTITLNGEKHVKAQALIAFGHLAATPILSAATNMTVTQCRQATAAISLGLTAINWGLWAKTSIENRNMRAYNMRRIQENREERRAKHG